MAKFSANGVGELMLSLEEVLDLPLDVQDKMLEAAAQIGVDAMKASISQLGLYDTGQLEESITAGPPKTSKIGHRYVHVYPRGARRDYLTVGKIRRVSIKGYRKSGKPIKTDNSEVGFVLEFGSPHRGIKAYQWMRTALEKSADAVVNAEFKIYDEWLKSKDL